jgi:hypothetical protein
VAIKRTELSIVPIGALIGASATSPVVPAMKSGKPSGAVLVNSTVTVEFRASPAQPSATYSIFLLR